jgi:hypothetical protein
MFPSLDAGTGRNPVLRIYYIEIDDASEPHVWLKNFYFCLVGVRIAFWWRMDLTSFQAEVTYHLNNIVST